MTDRLELLCDPRIEEDERRSAEAALDFAPEPSWRSLDATWGPSLADARP